MNETELVKHIGHHLDAQTEALDETTKSRLYDARRRALNHYHQGYQKQTLWTKIIVRIDFQRWRMRGVALASIVLVAAVTLPLWQSTQEQPFGAEDLEILAAVDSPEFYEDLEFYAWLAEQHAG
jgi:hypothetical protein